MTSATDPHASVREAESIIERLAASALDDDYYAEREGPPGPRSRILAAAVLALFGLLVTVAAVQTRNDRPATALERDALIENIQVREDLVDSKRETVAGLREEIAGLQASSDGEGPDTAALRIASGAIAVAGPGLILTVESADEEDRTGGRVSDTDLQLIVNGLWLAGAEAVAVDGHRLTATSAIRSAGEAITVNFRSVTEPIEVTAIGDGDTLVDQWTKGPSGRYLRERADTAAITYSVRGSDEVVLPPAPDSRLTVSAKPLRRSDS